MPNRFYEVTDQLNRRSYHVADTAHRLLTNLGVSLAPGERARFKQTYQTATGATIRYKQITKEHFEAGQEVVNEMQAVQRPQPRIYASIPPVGRRSQSLFGVYRTVTR